MDKWNSETGNCNSCGRKTCICKALEVERDSWTALALEVSMLSVDRSKWIAGSEADKVQAILSLAAHHADDFAALQIAKRDADRKTFTSIDRKGEPFTFETALRILGGR